MSLDQDVALLRALPLFEGFTPEQIRLIAFSAEPLSLPRGTILFREGAPADGAYVVVSGSVRLLVQEDGEAVERETVWPGALIGEIALIAPTTRPASAETCEPTQLMAISRRLFRRVLQEYPDMAERMRQALAGRLTALTADLAQSRVALLAEDSFPGKRDSA